MRMRYRVLATGDVNLPYAVKYKYPYWPFWFWVRCWTGDDWTPRAGFKSEVEALQWIEDDKKLDDRMVEI